jgi:hypothetical protein
MVRLRLDTIDFPSNIDSPKVDHLVVYLMSQNGPVSTGGITVTHAGQGGVGGSDKDKGLISTRRGNAEAWTKIRGTDADGIWELTFAPEASELFDSDRLQDVLFVVGYAGEVQPWPS